MVALDLTNQADSAVAAELACLARFATEPLPQAPKRALLTGTLRSLEGARAAHGVHSSPYKVAAGWLARGIGMVHPSLPRRCATSGMSDRDSPWSAQCCARSLWLSLGDLAPAALLFGALTRRAPALSDWVDTQVNNALHDAFGGKVVRQVVLLGSGGDLRAARRGLLQTVGSSHRDYHAWLDSSLMGMVGFALVIITLLSIVCLFSIEIKQDTILYGKGKTE